MSGRPSIRTPELEDRILDALADGDSMRAICEREDMPDRRTVLRWMGADDDFAARCARARLIQADAIADDMAAIEDRTVSGELDPAAARVVLSSKQWRASKLAPKKYGDKIEHEHKGGVTVSLMTGDDQL